MARRVQIIDKGNRKVIRFNGAEYNTVQEFCMDASNTFTSAFIDRTIRCNRFRANGRPLQQVALMAFSFDLAVRKYTHSIRLEMEDILQQLSSYDALTDMMYGQLFSQIQQRYFALFVRFYGAKLAARGVALI